MTFKKVALVSLLALSSGSALAAPALGSGELDTATAELNWKGTVPVVVPGNYTTITGLNGMPLTSGDLAIDLDGTFGSVAPIVTEVHLLDEATGDILGLVTEAEATELNWSVITDPTITATGSTNTSSASAILSMDGTDFAKGDAAIGGAPSDYNVVSWTVRSAAGGELTDINPGDAVNVTAFVQVETKF
ncbi:TPA: hypothetical protein ACX6RU_000632 [Photobacterium damselae]